MGNSKLLKAIARCNCGNCKKALKVSHSTVRYDLVTGELIPDIGTFKQCAYTHNKVNATMTCANWKERV